MDCGGGSICPHGRIRSFCMDCGGGGACPHGRQRSRCKDCKCGSTCPHGRQNDKCVECTDPSSKCFLCIICRETKQSACFLDVITGTLRVSNVCDICRTRQEGQEGGDEKDDTDESLLNDGELRPFGDLDRTIKCFQCEECLPIDNFPEYVDKDNFPTCISCQEKINHTPVQPCGSGADKDPPRKRGRGRQKKTTLDAADEDEADKDPPSKRGRALPKKTDHSCPHGSKSSYDCKKCGQEYRLECASGGIAPDGKRSAYCEHDRQKSKCKECGGSSICPHGREKSICVECGGSSICPHARIRNICKDCKGSRICPHERRRSQCKHCKGSGICPHERLRSRCRECNGSSICSHGKRKECCVECADPTKKCPCGKKFLGKCLECADISLKCQCGKRFLGKCMKCADPSLKCSCGKLFSRCKQCRDLRHSVLELRSSQGASKPDEPARSGDVESLICTGCRETKQPASFFDAITGTFVNVCDICRMGKGGQGRGEEDEEEDNDESLLEDGDPRPFGDLDRTIKCFQCEEYLPIDHFLENVDEDNFPTCTSCLEEIDHTPVQPCTGGCGKYIKPSRSGDPAICDGCKDL